ncbi:MAG: thiamine phosphate synthase [Oligosphaeraceae bacterium]|jgi:thiamine-phosphate pyrophosphorylase|nr:thiamine phosphate synthase [Oligosphaeraceae bacterium]
MDQKKLRKALLLYAVTDRSWLRGRSLSEQVQEALAGGVTCLQLREKDLPAENFLAQARIIQELCRKYQVPFLINDNIEIARECQADGAHVGQHDLNAGEARRRLGPGKILGVSASTVEQARRAEDQGADYLGVGAVFPTSTKLDAKALSPQELTTICGAVSIPVVAIGGINRTNIAQLAGCGLAGIAVVSAIFASEDITAASRELLHLSQAIIT